MNGPRVPALSEFIQLAQSEDVGGVPPCVSVFETWAPKKNAVARHFVIIVLQIYAVVVIRVFGAWYTSAVHCSMRVNLCCGKLIG